VLASQRREEPAFRRALVPELPERAPGASERVLDEIVGLGVITREPVAEAVEVFV